MDGIIDGTLKIKIIRLILIAALVIALDQVTKFVVMSQMALYESIPVIDGFFHLTRAHNPGGAFSFFAGQSELVRKFVFLGMTAVAIVAILYLYFQTPRTQPFLAVALALIFGGAVGNFIDRVRLGYVVDFLDFFIGPYHFPIFNVADSAISIGLTFYVGILLFHPKSTQP